jgi:hypothetical protein
MATYPTYYSVLADLAAGMSEAEAVQKAARAIAAALDEEALEALRALYSLTDVPASDTRPE